MKIALSLPMIGSLAGNRKGRRGPALSWRQVCNLPMGPRRNRQVANLPPRQSLQPGRLRLRTLLPGRAGLHLVADRLPGAGDDLGGAAAGGDLLGGRLREVVGLD